MLLGMSSCMSSIWCVGVIVHDDMRSYMLLQNMVMHGATKHGWICHFLLFMVFDLSWHKNMMIGDCAIYMYMVIFIGPALLVGTLSTVTSMSKRCTSSRMPVCASVRPRNL